MQEIEKVDITDWENNRIKVSLYQTSFHIKAKKEEMHNSSFLPFHWKLYNKILISYKLFLA